MDSASNHKEQLFHLFVILKNGKYKCSQYTIVEATQCRNVED